MPKLNPHTRIPEFNQSLADHLRAAGWAVYTEIPLGPVTSGPSVGRADVLALKKSYSVRAVIYECKTSRGDFQGDVNRGKYERYFGSAHQVYFATPAGMVRKEEVPSHCGLITRTEGKGWHTVKGATVRHLEIPHAMLLACLFREQEEKAGARRLRDRIDLRDNIDLRERAKGIGYEVRRKLSGIEDEWNKIREAQGIIDEFLGRKSRGIYEAIGELRRYVEDIRHLEAMPVAIELVQVASELVSGQRGTLWREQAWVRLRNIVEQHHD